MKKKVNNLINIYVKIRKIENHYNDVNHKEFREDVIASDIYIYIIN